MRRIQAGRGSDNSSRAAGIKYVHRISTGDVGDVAAQYVKDKQWRQIVMGTRGSGSVAGMRLGSVATKVLHFAEVPVLRVK